MNATLVSLASLLDAYAEDVEVHVSVAVLVGGRLLVTTGGPGAAAGQRSLPTVALEPGEHLLRAAERAGALAGLPVACGRLLVLVESIASARHRLTLTFAAAASAPPADGRGEWVAVRRLAGARLDPWLAFGLRNALKPGARAPVHVLGAELPAEAC